MIRTGAGARIRRRRFLQSAAAIAAGGGLSSPALGQLCPVKEGTVCGRLWVFCNPWIRTALIISGGKMCLGFPSNARGAPSEGC